MKPPGTYRLTSQPKTPRGPSLDDPLERTFGRTHRIVASLRNQIVGGGADQQLSIRKVFDSPREIYRIELHLPEMGYQRTTLLDRDTLEELLETLDPSELVDAIDA